MSILTSWSWSKAARAVSEALDAAKIVADDGGASLVAVIDQPRLAKLLAKDGRAVTAVGGKAHVALPAGIGAVVGVGAGKRGDWEAVVREWAAAVREGGAVVLVDVAERVELTRRALAVGLVDIEQRVAGRTIITSGRVRRI